MGEKETLENDMENEQYENIRFGFIELHYGSNKNSTRLGATFAKVNSTNIYPSQKTMSQRR